MERIPGGNLTGVLAGVGQQRYTIIKPLKTDEFPAESIFQTEITSVRRILLVAEQKVYYLVLDRKKDKNNTS